jgi:ESCRT-II complex subunit VPS22
MATRPVNGGIISLHELCEALRKVRARGGQVISPEDVKRAISKLKVLGGGYRVVVLGGHRYVLSVPSELSPDTTMVLQLCAAQSHPFASLPWLAAQLRWDEDRARRACQTLLTDGLAWLDSQAGAADGGARYYCQALWVAGASGGSAGASAASGAPSLSPIAPLTGSAMADGILRDDTDD